MRLPLLTEITQSCGNGTRVADISTANYGKLKKIELNERKCVIADYTFKNKILGFRRQGLFHLVYSSMGAFYGLMCATRFYSRLIFLTMLIVRGPRF
jgi:hypothetical protein